MAYDATKPSVSDNYSTGYTPNIRDNFAYVLRWGEGDSVTGTPPTNAKRYNVTNGLFEKYNGTAWVEMTLSYAKLASPTFTGTPAAPTASADTNTTQLATTAFVVGQAGGSTPSMNGTGAAGSSLRYSRQDHVHPTDTSRAPLASPNFSGTPQVGGQNIFHAGNFTPSNYAPVNNPAFTGTANYNADGLGNVEIGFRNVPIVEKIGNYTFQSSDRGKGYYHNSSGGAVSWTIPSGMPHGSAITIYVIPGASAVNVIRGSGVLLYVAGSTTNANATVATGGLATLYHVVNNYWVISGAGVS